VAPDVAADQSNRLSGLGNVADGAARQEAATIGRRIPAIKP
jgi:hypothetical protein